MTLRVQMAVKVWIHLFGLSDLHLKSWFARIKFLLHWLRFQHKLCYITLICSLLLYFPSTQNTVSEGRTAVQWNQMEREFCNICLYSEKNAYYSACRSTATNPNHRGGVVSSWFSVFFTASLHDYCFSLFGDWYLTATKLWMMWWTSCKSGKRAKKSFLRAVFKNLWYPIDSREENSPFASTGSLLHTVNSTTAPLVPF